MKDKKEIEDKEMRKRHKVDELLCSDLKALYYVTVGWVEALQWVLENEQKN